MTTLQDLEVRIGPQNPGPDNVALAFLRAIKDGSLAFTAVHAELAEAAMRNNVYHACNSAAVTFGTALTATGVTFHLCNPIGSLVDLVVLQCSLSLITYSTAGTIVYCQSGPHATAVTAGTALTVLNASGNAGVGLAKSATTLPAVPVALRPLAYGITAAGVGIGTDYPNGSIVVKPGAQLSVQGITTVGTGIIGMSWEEVPRLAS